MFASSFHPTEAAMAINDWTHKHSEPALTFPTSFDRHLIWLYNLRIDYHSLDIIMGEDDVANAFKHVKINSASIPMDSCWLLDRFVVQSGQTFGDNASPSNWEPIAQARSALAQWFWPHTAHCTQALSSLPPITFAAPPTAAESKNIHVT